MEDKEDSDVKILLVDALIKNETPLQSIFKINLEIMEVWQCIDLFR